MRRTITALFVTFLTASLLATAQDSKNTPKPSSLISGQSVPAKQPEPECSLIVFGSTYNDFDKDISEKTLLLGNAAFAVAEAHKIAIDARDITQPGGLRQLNRRVGGADKDDYLFHGGIILCRVWYAQGADGKIAIVSSPAEPFRILKAEEPDPTDPKKERVIQLTPDKVKAQTLDYLEKTATPPPGTFAALRLAKEQSEKTKQKQITPPSTKDK